jgi:hypothetical protein
MESVNGQADAIMTFNRRHFVSVRNPHLGDEQFGIEVLVFGSSATLAWIYGDETTEPIRRLFDLVADEGAVVPSLWGLELGSRRSRYSGMITRHRMAPASATTFVGSLDLLPSTGVTT